MTPREDSGMKSEFVGDFRNSVDLGWDDFSAEEKVRVFVRPSKQLLVLRFH